MAWFRHERSGQVFEAVGVWEQFARADRHTIEVPPPTLTTGEEAVQPSPEAPAGITGEAESVNGKEGAWQPTTPSSQPPSPARSNGRARRTKT